MKRFSAPASVYPDPTRPPDNDEDGGSESSLSDGSKKVKTAQSFESLFNSESLSDIVLNLNMGEFTFHAHKMIVGLKSERLAALITNTAFTPTASDQLGKPVLHLQEPPDCSAVFSRFLYFIYSGAVWLHRDYVIPLFKLSVKYGVGALASHCENYILQLLHKCLQVDAHCPHPPPTLCTASICDIYENDQHREDMRKAAFSVLSRRFPSLIRTERWIACSWTTVRDLLRSDDCACEENLVLVAATDWMKRNKLQDKARIQDILASIRYPRLPRRVLYHLHTTASFRNFPQVQALIEAAIRYHCFKEVPEAQSEFTGLQYQVRWKGRARHTVCGAEILCQTHGADCTSGCSWQLDDLQLKANCAHNHNYNNNNNGDHNTPSEFCDNNNYDPVDNGKPDQENIYSHHHHHHHYPLHHHPHPLDNNISVCCGQISPSNRLLSCPSPLRSSPSRNHRPAAPSSEPVCQASFPPVATVHPSEPAGAAVSPLDISVSTNNSHVPV